MLEPTQCTSVAELMVDGRVVGFLQCTEPAGHDVPGYFTVEVEGHVGEGRTPHRAALTWGDDDEPVEVPVAWRSLPEAIDLADNRERATWPRADQPTDPGPHPESAQAAIDRMSESAGATLAEHPDELREVGLCGVGGCVYTPHALGQGPHSWQRSSRSIESVAWRAEPR